MTQVLNNIQVLQIYSMCRKKGEQRKNNSRVYGPGTISLSFDGLNIAPLISLIFIRKLIALDFNTLH